jgi:hypothetical protein
MANNNLEYTLSLKDLFSKKMQEAASNTSKLDDKMSGLKSKLAGLAAGVGITSFAKSVIEVGSSFELAEVQLKTLLKSSLAAKSVFQDLQDESTRSPFGFDTLLKGNAALISTGISANQAKKDFNALANAISATGGTEDALQRMVFNLQQIKNTGQATSTDIKQFGMAGINIYKILDVYYKKNNISLKEQKGNYEQITGALELASQKGGAYFGALANASNTTAGRISNLKDSFMVMQDAIFNNAKPAINSIVSGLSSLMNYIKDNISGITFLLKVLIPVIAAYKLWAARIVIATVATKAYTIATTLATAWEMARAEGLGIATAAQWALNVAMNANPIGAVIVAITALVAILAVLISQYKTVQELHNESLQKNQQQGFNDEAKAVENLASKYEKLGMSKEKATEKAISVSKQMLKSDLEDLKRQNPITDAEKRIYQKRMSVLGGRGAALESLGGGSSTLGASGVDGAGGASTTKSLGTGTEVTGQRPQSLTINITKLVESLNVQTTNLTEGTAKIKEMVSKALLKTVNDANLTAMA